MAQCVAVFCFFSDVRIDPDRDHQVDQDQHQGQHRREEIDHVLGQEPFQRFKDQSRSLLSYRLLLSHGSPAAFGGWFFLEKKTSSSRVSTYGSIRNRSV